MSRKEVEIPEKIIKKKVKVEITCDVCADKVSTCWRMSSYYDGVNYEYTSPLDLCEHHQHYYERALRVLPHPFKYMKERYDNPCEEGDVKVLLDKVLELYEDDH